MSSAQSLREFVTERLTAAAEEIFTVFEKTIVEYEAEIDRQRRLLEVVWKPQIKLHRLEFPQKHVCKEEEVLTDQQLCDQERNSSPDQEDPEPPQIKEEQGELCTSQEGEQLVLKQETDHAVMSPTVEESDHSSEQQLLSHSPAVIKSQDQERSNNTDSGSTRNAEQKLKNMHRKNTSHMNNADISPMSETRCDTHVDEGTFKCDTCGKAFKCKSSFDCHLGTHTGEKPHVCNTCGKRFRETSQLKYHTQIHTGEKAFPCNTCGKRFVTNRALLNHRRVHTGDTPYT